MAAHYVSAFQTFGNWRYPKDLIANLHASPSIFTRCSTKTFARTVFDNSHRSFAKGGARFTVEY